MDQKSDCKADVEVDEELEKEIADLASSHAKKMLRGEELVSLKQRVLCLELRVKELEERLQSSFTLYPPVYSTTYSPKNTPYATDEAPQFLTGMSNGEITYYN